MNLDASPDNFAAQLVQIFSLRLRVSHLFEPQRHRGGERYKHYPAILSSLKEFPLCLCASVVHFILTTETSKRRGGKEIWEAKPRPPGFRGLQFSTRFSPSCFLSFSSIV